MLATKHPLIDALGRSASASTASSARLRLVRNSIRVARHPRIEWRMGSKRRSGVFVATIAVHAVLVAWLWHAKPWASSAKPPPRLEVALIATPEVPPPPPRPRIPDRATPKRPTHAITTALAPTAPETVPLTIPAPMTPMPIASPMTAIPSPIVMEAASPAAKLVAPPLEVVPPRFDAAYLDNPAPLYPAAAKRAGAQGRVLLRVLVSADGAAQAIEIARSSGRSCWIGPRSTPCGAGVSFRRDAAKPPSPRMSRFRSCSHCGPDEAQPPASREDVSLEPAIPTSLARGVHP